MDVCIIINSMIRKCKLFRTDHYHRFMNICQHKAIIKKCICLCISVLWLYYYYLSEIGLKMLMSRMTPIPFGKLNRLTMRSCDTAALYALTHLAVYKGTVISDSVYFTSAILINLTIIFLKKINFQRVCNPALKMVDRQRAFIIG